MKILQNIKIGVKTFMPMIFLLVMVLLSGMATVLNTQTIMKSSKEITNIHFSNVYYFQELNCKFAQLQRITYEYCLAEEESVKRELEAELDRIYLENETVIQTLANSAMQDDTKVMYAEFSASYEEFVVAVTEAITLSAQGKVSEASHYANTVVADIASELTVTIEEMVISSQLAMKEELQIQEDVYQLGMGETSIMLALSVMACVAVLIIIWISVVRPLKTASKQLNNIIDGIEKKTGGFDRTYIN